MHSSGRRWRRPILVVGAIVVLYVASYIPLSMMGGWIVLESGEFRIASVMMADQFEWQPRVGVWHRYRSVTGKMKTRADKLGFFYAPLIAMDQKWVHPTILFVIDGRDVDPIPAPPYSDYHPTKLSPFEGRYPYVEVEADE